MYDPFNPEGDENAMAKKAGFIVVFMLAPQFIANGYVYILYTLVALIVNVATIVKYSSGGTKAAPKFVEVGMLLAFAVGLVRFFATNASGNLAFVQNTSSSLSGVEAFFSGTFIYLTFAVFMWLSCLCGVPFTIQYAYDTVPEASWQLARFTNANFKMSALYAALFSLYTILVAVAIFAVQSSSVVGAALMQVFGGMLIGALGAKMADQIREEAKASNEQQLRSP